MRSSLNRINGNYMGCGELYTASGIYSTNKHYNRLLGTEWIRPPEWINIPDMSGITQGMVGLLAVIPGFTAYGTGWTSNHNFVAFRIQGAYTVDWGDGTVQNLSSGAIAGHTYNYYELPEGNLTREGYKQVVVTATPQAGATMTLVDVDEVYTVAGITQPAHSAYWLQLKFKIPHVTQFSNAGVQRFPFLKSAEYIGSTELVSSISSPVGTAFTVGPNVENISAPQEFTSRWVNLAAAFSFRNSLRTIPFLDTRGVTNANQAFRGSAMRVLPPLDTSNVESAIQMFQDADAIESIPFIFTSRLTLASAMFNRAYALRRVPTMDFSEVTTINLCFSECNSIMELPPMNTAKVVDANNAFFGMLSLKSVPGLSTANVNTAVSMFTSCTRVPVFPFLDLSGVTRGGSAGLVYNFCSGAWRFHGISYNPGYTGINPFGTRGAGTDYARPIVVDGLYVGGVSGASFSDFPISLSIFSVYGAGATLSCSNANLSPTQLNNIFTALASLTAGYTATINVSGNWGATTGTFYGVTCDTSIATSKGWIVIR